jgi:hypothetical protein
MLIEVGDTYSGTFSIEVEGTAPDRTNTATFTLKVPEHGSIGIEVELESPQYEEEYIQVQVRGPVTKSGGITIYPKEEHGGGEGSIQFDHLPYGQYAVIAFDRHWWYDRTTIELDSPLETVDLYLKRLSLSTDYVRVVVYRRPLATLRELLTEPFRDIVREEEVRSISIVVDPDTEAVGFWVDWRGSDLDLHVYDPDGRHIGFNYETGEAEIEVPYASYSGREAKPEWVKVRNPEPGLWRVEVYGYDVIGEVPFTLRTSTDIDAPSTPELISPENSSAVDNTPRFEWATVSDPSGVSYELQISNDPAFPRAPCLGAGMVDADHRWGRVNFPQPFDSEPVVVASMMTERGHGGETRRDKSPAGALQ